MLFKNMFGCKYCWTAVAKESCCEKHHEAVKMREEQHPCVGSGQRGEEER